MIARVAAGFARPDESWRVASLPHIGSTMLSLAESCHFSQPATGTVTDNVQLTDTAKTEPRVGKGAIV